jgi:hypothetical protein
MKLDPESASPYGVGNGPMQDMASQHMMQRLLERRSKNTVFLWTYLTHNYDIGDDIKLTEVNYRKWCGGNSQAWRDAVDDLLAMGAIEGKAKRKGRGSVYRRVI